MPTRFSSYFGVRPRRLGQGAAAPATTLPGGPQRANALDVGLQSVHRGALGGFGGHPLVDCLARNRTGAEHRALDRVLQQARKARPDRSPAVRLISIAARGLWASPPARDYRACAASSSGMKICVQEASGCATSPAATELMLPSSCK